jgi:NTE family protein
MTDEVVVSSNRKFGLALSGGGSRAIAFHLGCMRTLNDRGLLDHIKVLSTVSGGSVIGALWAYSDESFEDFDTRIQGLLRDGLKKGILLTTLFSLETPRIIATILISGGLAAFGIAVQLFRSIVGLFGITAEPLKKISRFFHAPLPRYASRTTAFIRFLNNEYFKGLELKDVKRKDLQIVINATELKTQTSFRYGSKETGSWCLGKQVKESYVAHAVAASAAFPGFLPAIDGWQNFERNGKIVRERIYISDGGVYDNIGTSCLIPGRNEAYSTNVHEVNFIIACVAGQGLPDASSRPYFFGSRMLATVDTIHRRTHSMTFDLLHRLNEKGDIEGFLLPYLGQNDKSLPCPPADLVPRAETFNYPTDFDPMSEKDIIAISKRGEQLTRNLIETYHPEL